MIFRKKHLNFLIICILAIPALIEAASLSRRSFSQDLAAAQAAQDADQQQASFCLVIDPGHGGKDSGVLFGATLAEKTLTLNLARKLQELIDSDPELNIKVLLTRVEDQDLPLDSRAAIANHHRADLFLSIHFGSYLYPAVESMQIFIADYSSEELEYLSMINESWSLMQSKHLAESREFGRYIEQAVRASGAFAAVNFLKAPIYFLKGASMAAVEVEAGFAPSEENIKKLESEDYQWQLAKILLQGIVSFLNKEQEQSQLSSSSELSPPAEIDRARENLYGQGTRQEQEQ